MLYKGIIILLYGFFKLNIFDKAVYRLRISKYCCKITFSDDERKFISYEMRNCSLTAEYITIM